MKNTLRTLFFFTLWGLAQAALAADIKTKSAPDLEIQIFDSNGNPAQNMGIDTSTGEPIQITPAVDTPLTDYHTQFLVAKTAQEMADFIAQYKANDPDKLVPRARVRMQTFAAFETALNAHQCAEAKKQHQRIAGYKVAIPFSFQDCERARSAHSAKKDAHDTASGSRNTLTDSQSPVLLPSVVKLETCPKNLGYLRSRMVYPELREHPSFDEPIEGIMRKAGGLDAAIIEVERLMRTNHRSLDQAALAIQQYQPLEQGDARRLILLR